MRYNPNVPWGGTDNPAIPEYPLGTPPSRNYGDLLYNLPDLSAFRALDHSPLPTQEDTDPQPAERPLTRRLLGALARPLTRISAQLDRVPYQYDPAQSDAARGAAFYLRLSGYPLPPSLPDAWALALLRHLPELLPVGRAETYLRTAEVIYGRGTRETTHSGEHRTRRVLTARGVGLELTDAQFPGGDRAFSITVSGPASEDFMRLLYALRPAAFSAVPVRQQSQSAPLLTYGEPL